MKFGMCVGDDYKKIKKCAEFGYDYIEGCFSLLTEKDDEYLAAFKKELDEAGLSLVSVNCFIPGRLKVTGPDVDFDALREYIEKGFSRGVPLGLKKVVFGSSGARNIPEGWSYAEACRQLGDFLREVVAPLADKYSVTVVVEPLSRKDSNIINFAKEGVMISAFGCSERIKGLVDLYHMTAVGDDVENIYALKGCIAHAHIARPGDRKYPENSGEYNYKAFVDALEAVGCDTCSVEGGCDDFDSEAAVTAKVLKSL